MARLIVFLTGSAAIVMLSWRSLRHASAHGLYRFFAFELILALILRNSPVWFRDPLRFTQWCSYLLGVVSIGLAVEGFRLLIAMGKPSAGAASPTNLGFENTTALVSSGAYAFIRHPLYASLLALAWCAWLKDPSAPAGILLAAGATAFLMATAITEERENLLRFGAPYAAYMKRTRRFVPFLL